MIAPAGLVVALGTWTAVVLSLIVESDLSANWCLFILLVCGAFLFVGDLLGESLQEEGGRPSGRSTT